MDQILNLLGISSEIKNLFDAGGPVLVILPVSYTHLTLPTKA